VSPTTSVVQGVSGANAGARSAGPQAEAGVVPRAADFVADDEAFGKRGAVMRAGSAHGVDAILELRQQHRNAIDMAGEHALPGYAGKWNALREVRARCWSVGLCHGAPPGGKSVVAPLRG